MTKFIPTLLLVPIYSLAAGVAYPADVPDGPMRLAAISAPLRANSAVVAPDAQGTFESRTTDLSSTQAQDPQQAVALSDMDEVQAVAIVTASFPSQMSFGTHVSHAGLGALYWAARNPAQAWRVLFPIQPRDGSGASEDLREKCAMRARAPGSRVACP